MENDTDTQTYITCPPIYTPFKRPFIYPGGLNLAQRKCFMSTEYYKGSPSEDQLRRWCLEVPCSVNLNRFNLSNFIKDNAFPDLNTSEELLEGRRMRCFMRYLRHNAVWLYNRNKHNYVKFEKEVIEKRRFSFIFRYNCELLPLLENGETSDHESINDASEVVVATMDSPDPEVANVIDISDSSDGEEATAVQNVQASHWQNERAIMANREGVADGCQELGGQNEKEVQEAVENVLDTLCTLDPHSDELAEALESHSNMLDVSSEMMSVEDQFQESSNLLPADSPKTQDVPCLHTIISEHEIDSEPLPPYTQLMQNMFTSTQN